MDLQHSRARTKLVVPELPGTHVPRPALHPPLERFRHRLHGHLHPRVCRFGQDSGGGRVGRDPAHGARSRGCRVTSRTPTPALLDHARDGAPHLRSAIGIDALDLLDAEGDLGHDAIASLVNDLFPTRMVVIDDLQIRQHARYSARSPTHESAAHGMFHVVLSTNPTRPALHRSASSRSGSARSA